MSDNDSPKKEGKECGRHDDGFDKKEYTKFLDGHQCQNCLEDPIEEETKEARRCNASVLGEMVGETLEAWPDRCDTILEEGAGLDAEDRGPHCRNEGSKTDGGKTSVHSEDRTDDDRKWGMVIGADLSCQGDDHGADGKPEEDDRDGLAGGEAERHHRAHGRSQRRSKHVTGPISPIILEKGRCCQSL